MDGVPEQVLRLDRDALLLFLPEDPLELGCRPSHQACRGLRKGVPLSSLLFIIDIDLLQRILELPTQKGFLHKIRGANLYYANDPTIFMAPIKRDINNLRVILRGSAHSRQPPKLGLYSSKHVGVYNLLP